MNSTTRSNALTVMAPLRPWGYWCSRAKLLLVGLFARSSPLSELRFIHFAQWIPFRSLPGGRGGRRRAGMVFIADFDGDLPEYLAAFGLGIATGMKWSFGSTVGFPGPRPTRGLIRYVLDRRAPEHVRYVAYPAATVKEVDTACATAAALDALRAVDPSRPAERVAAARAVVAALAQAPAPVRLSRWASVRAGLCARHRVSPFAVAVPVAAGAGADLARRLADLQARDPAMFERVGGTHVARLAPLDWARAAGGPADGDGDGHLLLAATVDGPADGYAERLVTGLGPAADEIFGASPGFPGHAHPRAAADWLGRHRLKPGLFFPCRSGMAVADVRRALDRSGRALAVAAAVPPLPPDQLAERLAQI